MGSGELWGATVARTQAATALQPGLHLPAAAKVEGQVGKQQDRVRPVRPQPPLWAPPGGGCRQRGPNQADANN